MRRVLFLTGASLLLSGCFGGCPDPFPVSYNQPGTGKLVTYEYTPMCYGTDDLNHAMGTYTYGGGLYGGAVHIGRY